MQPGYLKIPKEELVRRAQKAREMLKSCSICPNDCGVNRLEGEIGLCHAGANVKVASWNLHHGEEPPISGIRGSGTIFFSFCTLKCVYCQNWPISQKGNGKETDAAGLADMMLELKGRGAHNINFVTPTHYMPQILEALVIAVDKGFDLPIVYNTSGYEVVPALRLLDGIVDIYLPEMRYACDLQAKKYSRAKMYSMYNRAAIKEMFRQVGNLEVDEDGIAVRGLIIRHLVLPGGVSGTEEIMKFLSSEVSKEVHISLMAQYFPTYKSGTFPELDRKITADEYDAAVNIMEGYGLHEGWVQEFDYS
jgi:putative pyruvate formate lyase activating enzyme